MPGKSMSAKNTVLIDTNVIIHFLVGDHKEHFERAQRFFTELENGAIRAILLESVFTETVFVLEKVYRVERARIASLLERILRLKELKTDSLPVLRKALQIYASQNIDIVDCLICAYSIESDMEIFGFDKDLEKCRKLQME